MRQEVLFLSYLEARQAYPHLFSKELDQHPFATIIMDPLELDRFQEATQKRPGMYFISSHTASIVHPVQREDGRFDTYDQIVVLADMEQRTGIILIPVCRDMDASRIILNLHYRPAIHCWEVEIPSFSQRSGKTIFESIVEEAYAEAGAELLSDPRRLDEGEGVPLFPGIASHMVQVWTADVRLLPQEPVEKKEGIKGRVVWTRQELQESISRGTVCIGNRAYLTTLAHTLVAAYYADLKCIW